MNRFCNCAYTSQGLKYIKPQIKNDTYNIVIKGYPCSLIRKFIREAEKLSECNVFYDYNGNPVALYCENKNIYITDGMLPSSAEPVTFGAADDLVYLGQYENKNSLRKNSDRIVSLINSIGKCEKKCVSYLETMCGIAEDMKRTEKSCMNINKINRFASKLWKKYGTPPNGRVGKETIVFSDYITPHGEKIAFDEFNSVCKNITVVNDFSFLVSEIIVEKIRLYALGCGYDVISCADYLNMSKIRHIIIPELQYAVFSERQSTDKICGKRIRNTRFVSDDYSQISKNRIVFYKKAFYELEQQASKSLQLIENMKNKLDEIYLSSWNGESFIAEKVRDIYK